jgi:hypothetical protein
VTYEDYLNTPAAVTDWDLAFARVDRELEIDSLREQEKRAEWEAKRGR